MSRRPVGPRVLGLPGRGVQTVLTRSSGKREDSPRHPAFLPQRTHALHHAPSFLLSFHPLVCLSVCAPVFVSASRAQSLPVQISWPRPPGCPPLGFRLPSGYCPCLDFGPGCPCGRLVVLTSLGLSPHLGPFPIGPGLHACLSLLVAWLSCCFLGTHRIPVSLPWHQGEINPEELRGKVKNPSLCGEDMGSCPSSASVSFS